MTIRIEQRDGEPYGHVSVDGVDISRYVHSIDITLAARQAPEATVRMLPASLCVELPDEAVRLVHDDEPEREGFMQSSVRAHAERAMGAIAAHLTEESKR